MLSEHDVQQLRDLVEAYKTQIHDQDEAVFRSLWAQDQECSLISIAKEFRGVDAIWSDFLMGRIHALYSAITLVTESLDIRPVNDDAAVVIFAYHTVCTRREDGALHGIHGLETQVMVREAAGWKLVHVHYSKAGD
ncbi:MAG: nuclear transport factor 2 family protein [Clostridia bacterium]|nr:nuclear transport factor 2 family protein [Clostridia bacterium]